MGKKKAGGVRVKQVGGPKGGAAKNPMDMMPTMEDFATKPEDQIHLPPTPDRNYSVVWPITETFTMKTDVGFQIIYPSYLDAEKTVKQGRRVAKDVAVPKPTVSDMSLALQALQIRHVLQPYKGYSRDPSTLWDNPGRVVVDMSSPSSIEESSSECKKSALMRKLCEKIPHLPERQRRLKVEAEQAAIEQAKRQEEVQKVEAAKKTAVTAAAASSSSSKKKGKKGRKK